MLVLSTLNALLAQLTTSYLHTAILITPQGHLVAYSTQSTGEDRIRVLVGLSSEVWREGIEGNDEEDGGGDEKEGSTDSDGEEEQVGMLECELGRLLVFPIYATGASHNVKTPSQTQPMLSAATPPAGAQNHSLPVLLLALNATESEPWGLMHTKARALSKYLAEPLASIGDRLSPGTSPARARTGVLWGR